MIAIVVQGYWAAGWLGASFKAPGAEARSAEGVPIFVEDNGIHTGIVLPKALLTRRLAARFKPADLADPRYGRHEWLAVGWGDRAFYIGTPTWADLSLSTVAAAAMGSDSTVLHVEHVPAPRQGGSVRRLFLRPDQAARLVAFIDASLGDGAPLRGYGGWDVFYPARGRYSAIRTCNAWTGEALKAAGVPMGRWTPFSGTVMWWL
ncbi:TIGR02117 family protein [Sphingomonas spermidinifaciens]|uniref:TIGR02117 family protein n=1 Tax=Sphingomonas spermidinifaciens TaxID=1141889 RepID=A0A2A4B9Z0_9SPHN|nr:TIGR02117 family protein [Sphingomonas spermidinifaciens]